MILKTGPDITEDIFEIIGLLLKAPGSLFSSSSPSIRQNPPMGNALSEYTVSPNFLPIIFGPIPSANSTTFMPPRRAAAKCPASCTNTIKLNTSIAAINVITYTPFHTNRPVSLLTSGQALRLLLYPYSQLFYVYQESFL